MRLRLAKIACSLLLSSSDFKFKLRKNVDACLFIYNLHLKKASIVIPTLCRIIFKEDTYYILQLLYTIIILSVWVLTNTAFLHNVFFKSCATNKKDLKLSPSTAKERESQCNKVSVGQSSIRACTN